MAIGKGSLNRAASAASKKEPVKKETAAKEPANKVATTKEAAKKAPVKKTPAKKAPARKATAKVDKSVIAAPSKEVLDAVVYQESSQVLYRVAEPNEVFGLGDAMPVYYL